MEFDFDRAEREFSSLDLGSDAPAWFAGCPDCVRAKNRWVPCELHRCKAIKSNGKRCKNAANRLSRVYCDYHRCYWEYRRDPEPGWPMGKIIAGCPERAVAQFWELDQCRHSGYCAAHHRGAEAKQIEDLRRRGIGPDEYCRKQMQLRTLQHQWGWDFIDNLRHFYIDPTTQSHNDLARLRHEWETRTGAFRDQED